MVAAHYDYGIDEPLMRDAIAEIQDLVRSTYPDAAFEVFPSSTVGGVYMRIIVDIDDPDDVTALIIDRVADLQINHELPLYPVTVRPTRRAVAELDTQDAVHPIDSASSDHADAL